MYFKVNIILKPTTNAARCERYFHIKEPDGYQLSFAKSIDDREENL